MQIAGGLITFIYGITYEPSKVMFTHKGPGRYKCALFAKRANSNWYCEVSPNWAIPYFRGGRLWVNIGIYFTLNT